MDKKIIIRLFLLFIPVAYASYLFHEFGHWLMGELLGNKMVYTLNLVWPKSGHYIDASHSLYVSMGGPAFSILLAVFFLLLIEKYKTVYAYPFVFFQLFGRCFSLFLGGFAKQDEAWISAMLGIGKYTAAIIVLLLLFLITWRASHKLKIGAKNNNYFITMSTLGELLVIWTYKMFL